eukprot:1182232-Amphidinium_carterae.1
MSKVGSGNSLIAAMASCNSCSVPSTSCTGQYTAMMLNRRCPARMPTSVMRPWPSTLNVCM